MSENIMYKNIADKLQNAKDKLQNDYQEAVDKIEELKADNQELQDSITWWNNRYNALQRDYEEQKRENQDLSRMCELYSKSLYYAELTDYKTRCEKAVEYVEQHKFNKFGDIDCGEAEAIITILNGSDK